MNTVRVFARGASLVKDSGMSLNQILNMIMRIVMRRAINSGINAGMRRVRKPGGRPRQAPPSQTASGSVPHSAGKTGHGNAPGLTKQEVRAARRARKDGRMPRG